jgi:hypothetical protein
MTDTADPAISPLAASQSSQSALSPSAPEDPPMKIHKVKPIHTWHDFLKELGTIWDAANVRHWRKARADGMAEIGHVHWERIEDGPGLAGLVPD